MKNSFHLQEDLDLEGSPILLQPGWGHAGKSPISEPCSHPTTGCRRSFSSLLRPDREKCIYFFSPACLSVIYPMMSNSWERRGKWWSQRMKRIMFPPVNSSIWCVNDSKGMSRSLVYKQSLVQFCQQHSWEYNFKWHYCYRVFMYKSLRVSVGLLKGQGADTQNAWTCCYLTFWSTSPILQTPSRLR